MARPFSIFWQVFLAVLATALGAVVLVGLIARWALSTAFHQYLANLPMPKGGGMGRGRMMLGAAEQTFVASVDRSVLFGSAIAVMLAILAAYLIARHLSRPIRELEDAALYLAGGDLDARVESSGPAEVRALGDAFNHLADSLSTAEQLRRRLVADVAHELRNPIAAARAQAEGMAEGVLPADSDRLESVVDDLSHLSTLVDDLQELALAEAGELRYEMRELDVGALAVRESRRAEPNAPSGVELRAETPAGATLVQGDDTRLSEVLRNLLGNALRHTASGSVVVRVTDLDHEIRVAVVDSGEGIPAEDLPFVFERFYRADAARAEHTGGAGLGLAISRKIVEDHGGQVFAESTPGGGATVGFVLPRSDSRAVSGRESGEQAS